jgi:hypothetical protein
MSKLPGRARVALVGVAIATLSATLAPGANATAAASDTMFPAWQGTSHSSAAAGHQIDCTDNLLNNPYWQTRSPAGGNDCTVSIYTVTSGSNCYHELVDTPLDNITGSSLYSNTTCQVKLDGLAEPQGAPGSADCAYDLFLWVNWQSGVRSQLFGYQSDYPVTVAVSEVKTTTTYHVGVVGAPDPLGQPLSVAGHYLSMKENFVAKFTSNVCPGDGRQQGGSLVNTVKASVYDPVADVGIGTDAGYFEDTVEY